MSELKGRGSVGAICARRTEEMATKRNRRNRYFIIFEKIEGVMNQKKKDVLRKIQTPSISEVKKGTNHPIISTNAFFSPLKVKLPWAFSPAPNGGQTTCFGIYTGDFSNYPIGFPTFQAGSSG